MSLPKYCNFFNMLCVTELPEVFLTLGTKLGFVLSFFTLRRDFMDLKKTLTFDEHGDKLVMGYLLQTEKKCFKRSTLLLFYTLD